MTLSHQRRGLLMAAVTALTWSVLAIVLKVSLAYASSETIVWFRFTFAAAVLFAYFLLVDAQDIKILFRPPVLGVICAVSLAVNYLGYMKGVELTSPSNAQILIQMAPLLLILSGILFFRERPTRWQLAGFLTSLTGFLLFSADQLAGALENRDIYWSGNLWIVLSAVTWAAYASLQKKLSVRWRPQQINLLIYVVSAITLLPLSDMSEIPRWDLLGWTLMLFLGANTLIAYGALGYALKNAPASQVSVILTVNPLFTLLFMKVIELFQWNWIEPDTVTWQGYLGALFVITGLIVVITHPEPSKAVDNKHLTGEGPNNH